MYKKGFLAEDSFRERTDFFLFFMIDYCIGSPHYAAATSVRDQLWVHVRGPAGLRTVTNMSKSYGYVVVGSISRCSGRKSIYFRLSIPSMTPTLTRSQGEIHQITFANGRWNVGEQTRFSSYFGVAKVTNIFNAWKMYAVQTSTVALRFQACADEEIKTVPRHIPAC